jgi:hypothetical protein
MIDPRIPDEAVEAMLNRMGSFFSSEEARAALAAAINAWPEMHVWDANQVWHHPSIVLPLQAPEGKP